MARGESKVNDTLDRPRDLRDPQLHRLRDQLTDLLADEVDRAFAEQEKRIIDK